MKKLISFTILTAIMFGATSLTFAQSLKENKVDEFTKNTIKRTSWETLNMTLANTAYYRISQIDSFYFFDLKLQIARGKVFSITKDQKIMFKLENNEIIELSNLEYSITCNGCGAIGLMGSTAQGIHVSYPFDKEQLDKLNNNLIVKIRIYTDEGHFEVDINEKKSKIIARSLSLVL